MLATPCLGEEKDELSNQALVRKGYPIRQQKDVSRTEECTVERSDYMARAQGSSMVHRGDNDSKSLKSKGGHKNIGVFATKGGAIKGQLREKIELEIEPVEP